MFVDYLPLPIFKVVDDPNNPNDTKIPLQQLIKCNSNVNRVVVMFILSNLA